MNSLIREATGSETFAASPNFISTIADKTVAILNVHPLHPHTSGKSRTPDFSDAPMLRDQAMSASGELGAALAAHKPEPQGIGPRFADRLSVHANPCESAIDNLEH